MKVHVAELNHLGTSNQYYEIEIPQGRIIAVQASLVSNKYGYGAAQNLYFIGFNGPIEDFRFNTTQCYYHTCTPQPCDYTSKGKLWFRGNVAESYTAWIALFYEDDENIQNAQELRFQGRRV